MLNHTSDPVEVPLSRMKISLLLLGSAGFVAIAVALDPQGTEVYSRLRAERMKPEYRWLTRKQGV